MRFLPALARAAGEGRAGATGEDRAASAAAGSSSSKSSGAKRAAHVPLDVVGEHAEEDVGADPAFEAVVDGAHLEIDGLVAAERPFDPAQALVGPDRLFRREFPGGHVGADDVDSVQRGLFGDAALIARVGEAVVGALGVEVLADLVAAKGPVGADGDHVLAPQRPLLAPGRGHDLVQLALGGGEQVQALAGPLGCQQRVAAHDEALAGVEFGRGDLGQILLVEEGELQGSAVDQLADRRAPVAR